MDQPTLRQLEYAVSVADQEHFGRAAAAMHVSQPALSSQIRELESRLGVELFERSPRGVTTSAAGREVVERSRAILRDVADLQQAASAHAATIQGQLRIAAIPTTAPYYFPAIVRILNSHWPAAHLELQERQTDVMIESLRQGDLDLGLLAIPYDTPGLVVEALTTERFHVALPEGHDLDAAGPLPIDALTDLRLLLLPEGHCLRGHAVEACEVAGRVEHSTVQAASLATLSQMVAAGIGITLLPAGAVPVEARPGTGIVTRELAPPAPGRTIALAWRDTDPRHALFAELPPIMRPALEAVGGG